MVLTFYVVTVDLDFFPDELQTILDPKRGKKSKSTCCVGIELDSHYYFHYSIRA